MSSPRTRRKTAAVPKRPRKAAGSAKARKTAAVLKRPRKAAGPAKARKAASGKTASPVLGVSPSYLKALADYERATAHLHKRDFRKAEELFQKLIDDYSAERDLADRARVYVNLCRKQTETASKLQGFDDHYYHGVFLTNRGEFRQAIDMFQRALELRPGSGKVHFSMASAYARIEERGRALELLRKAMDLDAGNRLLARQDPDFQSLKGDPEFEELLGRGGGNPVE